jgi:PAS domain S-box-containing protein
VPDYKNKSKEDLINELEELKQSYDSLKFAYENLSSMSPDSLLLQSEEKYDTLLENITLGIFQVSQEGKFLNLNNAVFQTLGYNSADEMIQDISDLKSQVYVNPKDREIMQKLLSKHGKVKDFEVQFRKKDGGIIWTEINVKVVKDKDGKVLFHEGFGKDVTKRKQVETALKHSQNLYHDLVETSQDLIWICNPEGKYTYLNPAWELVFGYKIEEMMGRKFSDFQTPERAATDELEFSKCLNGHIIKGFETVHIGKGGKEIHLVFNAKYVTNEEGNIIGTRGTAYDISERKWAEAMIKESENLHRKMNENSPLGMHFYKLNNSGQLIFTGTNPAADKLLGIDNTQFIGKPIEEAFPPLSQTDIPNRYLDAAVNGIQWSSEQFTYKDEKITGAFHVRAFQTPGSMVALFDDITERKLAEFVLKEKNDEIEAKNKVYQQLNEVLKQTNLELNQAKQKVEESEEKFRLMVKNSNDTIVLINENREQFYISDAVIRDTGFAIEELKGPIQNMVHPDDWTAIKKLWYDGITKKGEVVRVQYRHKHKYKDYIWCEAVAQNFIDNPTIKAVVVNVRDITSIKETELELIKAKEKAEESDRLKTAFLQNMSHEIRTPMNAIMGFTDLLKDEYTDGTTLITYSEIINQRCNDLLEIINDILDIAKIESGQLSVNFEECNLNELFAELYSFFTEHQKRIDKEHITFGLNSICDLAEGIIVTDKVKLKQIFINLISNAFKFTLEGWIEGGCKLDKNNNLLFYVSDTGIGIPYDKQELIFERFTQFHQSSIRNISGTGLGLSIVKGLVDLLGGEIFLKSEPGKGSTFSFSIPCKMAQTVKKSPIVIEKPDNNKLLNKTILIVEDDFYNTEYLKVIFARTGIHILETEYGKEAVELAIKKPIDLVLMDIRLPDMDGYEATRQIRRVKPGLTIIAQTAYASFNEKQNALDAGCNDYISKPIKKDLLLLMVNKYLADL